MFCRQGTGRLFYMARHLDGLRTPTTAFAVTRHGVSHVLGPLLPSEAIARSCRNRTIGTGKHVSLHTAEASRIGEKSRAPRKAIRYSRQSKPPLRLETIYPKSLHVTLKPTRDMNLWLQKILRNVSLICRVVNKNLHDL